MAKMDPHQYIETLKPMIEKSLATQGSMRTEAVAGSEPHKDRQEQSYVDAGALVSFTNRLSAQNKEDVLYGTLLAQLAANKVADRTKQTKAWYEKYVDVLSNIGWVIQSCEFIKFEMEGESFAINKALLFIMKDLVSEDERDLIERTIDSLKSGDNQPRWDVFSKESSGSFGIGNFQVCPCQQDMSGQVVMALGSFHFQTSETDDSWLRFNYNALKMAFFYSIQTCTLDEDVYGQVRHKVKDMLKDHARKYIGGLKL